MNELERICLGYRVLVGRAEPAYLATLVGGATIMNLKPGARLLFTERNLVAGSFGNARLEADVMRRGPWMLRRERPRLVHYEGGAVRVLLECVGPRTPGPLPLVEGCLREERRGAIATVIAADQSPSMLGARVQVGPDAGRPSPRLGGALRERLLDAARRAVTHGAFGSEHVGDVEAFIEAIEPPPHLFVFGSGSDATSGAGPEAPGAVTLAHSLGWRVTYCDSTGLNSARDRFPRNAAVLEGTLSQAVEHLNRAARPLAFVISQHRKADAKTLGALLGSRALYVGALDPTRQLPADALSLVAEAQAALSDSGAHTPSPRRVPMQPALVAAGGVS